MAPKGTGYRVGKTTVVDLLDHQANISADDLQCGLELNALLMCMSLHMKSTDDEIPHRECAPEEKALARCEMKMGNRTTRKLRTDMKKSLVFNLLRLTNFTKKLK
jgi:hypothetical protein